MSARKPTRAWQAVGVLLALLGVMCWQAHPVHAQAAIQIIKLRDLNFGGCDNVGGATYTVAAAASPGAGACFGAQSGQFTVTGDLNRRARVTLPNRVDVTNGTETIRVDITHSVGGIALCLGPTGSTTVYVGGSLTLPGAGLTTFGVFINADQFELTYLGGSC